MLQVCSVYSQLLQLFSRGQFARAVKHHEAERNAKGFSSWEQFVAMLFCQLAHLNSLREVCMGLASCESPLKHLGISTAPKKSTLAYTNANRPWELYESIFMQLLEKCQIETAAHSRRKFRFKNKLMSLDGSVIELSATMFDWAKYTQQKGAIKLHRELVWIHAPGMILTAILGGMALSQENNGEKVHGIASAHSYVAWTTVGAYGASIIAVSWPLHLKFWEK